MVPLSDLQGVCGYTELVAYVASHVAAETAQGKTTTSTTVFGNMLAQCQPCGWSATQSFPHGLPTHIVDALNAVWAGPKLLPTTCTQHRVTSPTYTPQDVSLGDVSGEGDCALLAILACAYPTAFPLPLTTPTATSSITACLLRRGATLTSQSNQLLQYLDPEEVIQVGASLGRDVTVFEPCNEGIWATTSSCARAPMDAAIIVLFANFSHPWDVTRTPNHYFPLKLLEHQATPKRTVIAPIFAQSLSLTPTPPPAPSPTPRPATHSESDSDSDSESSSDSRSDVQGAAPIHGSHEGARVLQPYTRYGLAMLGKTIHCGVCSRTMKGSKESHLVDHLISYRHTKRVQSLTLCNKMPFLAPPGHAQRWSTLNSAGNEAIRKDNNHRRKKKQKIDPTTLKARRTVALTERQAARSIFTKGHSENVRLNVLPHVPRAQQGTIAMVDAAARQAMLNGDIVTALLVDGRPMTVADTFNPILRKHVPYGGHALGSHHLRSDVYPGLATEHHAAVKSLIMAESGDGLIVVADETTDQSDDSIMAVSVLTSKHLFLLGIQKVEPTTHNGIGYAQVVSNIWSDWGLDGTLVRRFITDNDAKWNVAWRAIDDKDGGGLSTLWPYARRGRCFCHVLNLVFEVVEGHAAMKCIAEAISLVRTLINGLRNVQRRQRMQVAVGGILPDPCATRHDSWIHSATWFHTRIASVKAWLQLEVERYPSTATMAALQHITNHRNKLNLQAAMLHEHLLPVVELYHKLEKQTMPTPGNITGKRACQVFAGYDKLCSLQAVFTNQARQLFLGPLSKEMLHRKTANGSSVYDVDAYTRQFCGLFESMGQKLDHYMNYHTSFLKQCRILHPKHVAGLNHVLKSYHELFTPVELNKLQDPRNGEWHMYVTTAHQANWQAENFDIFQWWEGNRALMPTLAAAALTALATPLHSMDVERVFSRLGGLISPQRMGLQLEGKWTHLSFMVHGDVGHRLV